MSKPSRRKWQDISDILTDKGMEALKAGQWELLPFKVGDVMKFDFEGSPNHLRIMRFDKRGKIWAKETRLYHRDEIKVVDRTGEAAQDEK